MSASRRLDALTAVGVRFVAGHPLAQLARFFEGCRCLPASSFLSTVREDHAVAACAGAWLGGRRAVAVMPSSGLGNCLAVLSALHLHFGLPLGILAAEGGSADETRALHPLERRTRELLDLFAIPWRTAAREGVRADSSWLVETAETHRSPAVLFIPHGVDA